MTVIPAYRPRNAAAGGEAAQRAHAALRQQDDGAHGAALVHKAVRGPGVWRAEGRPHAVHAAQHGAVTVKELRALIALPEVRLRGLADAGYAGEQQPAVARGDERGVQDHGVPLQQQGLEGNVGEAVGRLGEKAPVGLQIFDGLAPVWLQMADSIGPVALTPVVEDAKKPSSVRKTAKA